MNQCSLFALSMAPIRQVAIDLSAQPCAELNRHGNVKLVAVRSIGIQPNPPERKDGSSHNQNWQTSLHSPGRIADAPEKTIQNG